MAKILVVEDESDLCDMICDWLTHEHYEVEVVKDGLDAYDRVSTFAYDLIVLDWAMPRKCGLEILKDHRRSGGMTPVLIISGRQSVEEKESVLDSGADDYLTKPFHMKELSGRIRALLRRASGQTSNVLKVGDLVLDPQNFAVTSNGREIYLQRREFALLEFLMRNPNKVFSIEALLERVWLSDSDVSHYAIRACIKRLRGKMDAAGQPSHIRTLHGVGYKLENTQT